MNRRRCGTACRRSRAARTGLGVLRRRRDDGVEREDRVARESAARAPQLLEARLVGCGRFHEAMERRSGRGCGGGATGARQGQGLLEEPVGLTRQLGELPLERLVLGRRRVPPPPPPPPPPAPPA